MTAPRAPFDCRVAGARTTLEPTDDACLLAGERLDWLDVDGLAASADGPARLTLRLADGRVLEVDQIGRRGDECVEIVRELRGRARRAALTQATTEPTHSFVSRLPDGRVVDVHLFTHTLVAEPRDDEPPVHVPLPLVRAVERDGWVFTLRCRGIDDVALRGLGPRSDEFGLRVEEARAALQAATSAAVAGYDPALAGLVLPDGWAVPASGVGDHAAALVTRWTSGSRGAEVAALRDLVGEEGLRYGMWTQGGTTALPFVLASRGAGAAARVAVEAVDADDRATFVFATDDVDRLDAALVLSAFRREVFSLPDDGLGRWAVAVRTLPHVQWARSVLVARVVHGPRWAADVAAALT